MAKLLLNFLFTGDLLNMKKTENLITKILDKHLKTEVENLLAITHQGFDVYVFIEFPEITLAFKKILENEMQINSRVFKLITNSENVQNEDLDFAFIPTVLIGNHILKHGTGFVRYSIESPDKLIGNVAQAISEILNSFNLQNYLDCFDAKIFLKLKEIAKIRGVQCLIDAVIQTAYLAGFVGNYESAHHYLDTFNISKNLEVEDQNVSIETCAKRFLSYCITHGDDAFSFLKSSLSFYVVTKQGHTLTRASEILNISRTTLMEHLKIAEKIGVPTFFEHGSR